MIFLRGGIQLLVIENFFSVVDSSMGTMAVLDVGRFVSLGLMLIPLISVLISESE